MMTIFVVSGMVVAGAGVAGAASTAPLGTPGAVPATSAARPSIRAHAATTPADASGSLSTILSVQGTDGYVAAGAAMRDLGHGTVQIAGIPAKATVVSATLLWDVLADQADPSFTRATIDNKAVTGTQWASGASPCWPVGANFSYEADVTSVVSGNGSYDLTGFASGQTDGADPWGEAGSTPPMLEGASLIVIYQDAALPNADIQVAGGATESDRGATASATLSGFTAGHGPMSTTFVVADGQTSGNTAAVGETTLDGVDFHGADPQAAPAYTFGNLWDTVTSDVGDEITPGSTSADISVTGNEDCIVWVGQVLDVTTGSICPVECLQATNAVSGLDAGGPIPVPAGMTEEDSEVNAADGFAAAEFEDDQGNIIIADEGAQPVSLTGRNSLYQKRSTIADTELYAGRFPAALNDAVEFAQSVQAQADPTTPIYVTGFDLGGAEAQAQAQALQSTVTGGATFGAPGLPGYTMTSAANDLVNYVDYGDGVGNFASDPGGALASLAPKKMNHYGTVSLVGDPAAETLPLLAANTQQVRVLNALDTVFGPNWTGRNAFDGLLNLSTLPAATAIKIYDKAMRVASFSYLAGSALLYHSIPKYAQDLGVSLRPTVTPAISMAAYEAEFDPSATNNQLTDADRTKVGANGSISGPGFSVSADTADAQVVSESYVAQHDSRYDVQFDPAEQVSTVEVDDPNGSSYVITNDDSGTRPWSTSVDFYSRPNASGRLTATMFNWRAGGSQLQVFVGLPKRFTSEFLNYSGPDTTGKLLSKSFE